MSAQSAKKKRIGSRRRVATKNKTSEVDEVHVTESDSAQHCIPEENTESINVSADPYSSQIRTQNPASPELTGNRRKFGSSRRNKGGHCVKDSPTESYHQPDKKTIGIEEAESTEMSQAIQPLRQEDIVSLTNDSSLYSSFTPDYSSELQYSPTATCLEADLESLIPKGENPHTDQDENETNYESCKLVETVLGETATCETHQSEEVKENTHLVGISELTSSSVSNSREMPNEEYPNFSFITEEESNKREEDTEMLGQDGKLQGNYLKSGPHIESVVTQFSNTSEIIIDKNSPRENTEVQFTVEKAIFSSPNKYFPKEEEQNEHFNLPDVKGTYYLEEADNKMNEEEYNPRQMHEIDHSSESVTQDAKEKSENLIDQAEVSDKHQLELIVQSSEDFSCKQDSNPGDKQYEHPVKEKNIKALESTKIPQIDNIERVDTAVGQVYEGEGRVEDEMKPNAEQIHQEKEGLFSEMVESESSEQTLQLETNAPLASQPQDNSVGIEEQTHTDFSPFGNRRKLGSSRKNKGLQQVKESVAESYDEHKIENLQSPRVNEALETTQMLVALERHSQEEFSKNTEHNVIMLASSPDSSLFPAIMGEPSSGVWNPTTPDYPEDDLDSLIPKSGNRQDHDEREADFKVEAPDKTLGAKMEGMDKSDFLQSQEVRDAHHSEDTVNKVQGQKVNPTQMHETDHSSESVTQDATENPEKNSRNLIDQAEVIDTHQSELMVKSIDDSATKQEKSNPDDKQDVHPTTETNFEALEQTKEDYHVNDAKKLQVSGLERAETASGKVYKTEGQVEEDRNPTGELIHQENEAPLDSQPQQSDTGFNRIGNRRKLGSSRKSKGRQHAKESVAESYHHTEEVDGHTRKKEPVERTKMALTVDTAVEEKSMETMLEGMETFANTQTEEVNGQEVEKSHVGILAGNSQLSSSILHSSLTADQQLIDKSYFTENPEELPNVYSVTGEESRDVVEDTESLRWDGNVEDSCLLSESHLRSKDKDSSITQGIITEKHSPREHTEPECSVEEALVSSAKEELPTSEEQNDENLTVVTDAPDSNDNVSIHEQEVKPTQMHEIDHSFESVTQDSTEKSENISENSIDQEEVSHTEEAEVIVKSSDDSSTEQEHLNHDDKQDEHPTMETIFEALEHQTDDYHENDTKIPPTENTGRGDTTFGQVCEGQQEGGTKPSAEQPVDQEKEGLFSEMVESESSEQALQLETNAPVDSQPQDNSVGIEEQTHTDFSPFGNRRKLGSSRRNKGRQQVKESVAQSYHEHKVEVAESTTGYEALETAQMIVDMERHSQEEFSKNTEHNVIMLASSPDSSLFSAIMQEPSSGVWNSTAPDYPEDDLDSLIPKSGNLKDHDEREADFKVEAPDKTLGAKMEGMDKSDFLQSQEVRDAHHSEDTVNKVQGQKVNPTQMHETDHSSESVTQDATENPEKNSRNLIDQAEVIDTHQSELMVKSIDDSATKQEKSNPDDKQDVHPTTETNFEALEQTKEDYHVNDAKKLQVSGLERAETASGKVYKTEGQVEKDRNPSGELIHQENEASLDSQPQQSDTGFNRIGNRRKLGSSRKSKGRQHAKESVAESYHHTEEVDGHTRKKEPVERTKMALTVDTAVEEKSMETMLEGMETFANTQTEEVNGQEVEKSHVGTLAGNSQLSSSILHSSLTADQQLIDKSYFTENPEELPNVYSVTGEESRDVVEDTESLRWDGNVEDSCLLSESHLRSKDKDSSITQGIITEKHSPREHTEPECSVEEALVSLAKEELPTSEEQNDENLTVVTDAHDSNDNVSIHEQEVKPTQMHEIDHSSESVTQDSTEKSENISENRIDQEEVSQTDEAEMIVKSSDDSSTEQEHLNHDDKQDEHPTMETIFEALEHQTDDYHENDTKILPTENTGRGDTTFGQVCEGQQEGGAKPSAEQPVDQEKEGLFSEMVESESSEQALQLETNAPVDSQPQDNSVGIDEQTHTDFSPFGNRRKLGSSRRNKGRQQVKESVAQSYHEHKVEVAESTTGYEALETAQMIVDMERQSQEEFSKNTEHNVIMLASSPDSSLFSAIMQEPSSGVWNPTAPDYPEDDLDSLIPKSGNLQDHDEREADFKVEAPDKTLGAKMEGMDKSDFLQSQEVRDAHHSEDTVNKVQGQKVNPTQMHETDHSSESVTQDATENPEKNSRNLIDQAEVIDTHQSELMVKSIDDSATKQEKSNPDDKQDVHPTMETNFEALEQTKEDYHVNDAKKLQVSGLERAETASGKVYKTEGQVEKDRNPSGELIHQENEAPLDSQPQQSDTGFNRIGNRRKLGSSRKSKGRQHAKESVAESYHHTEEVDGHTRKKEPVERTKMALTVDTAVEEKSMETMLEGMETFATAQTEEVNGQEVEKSHVGTLAGNSQLSSSILHSSLTADQQLIDKSYFTENPEELPNVYSVTGEESRDVVEDTESLRWDGNVEDSCLLSESHLRSKDKDSSITQGIITEKHSPREHTEPECSVEEALVSSAKEELPTSEEQNDENLTVVTDAHDSNDNVSIHEQEVKPTQMHEIDHSSESVTQDSTEKSENISENRLDQEEVSHTDEAEVIVKSSDDSSTEQEHLNHDDKQDEHPTMETIFEALEHQTDDYHENDTKIPPTENTGRGDTTFGQVCEGQQEGGTKPSAEQPVDQEKEGLFSEMVESESSEQALQLETNAPVDSQPQDNSVGIEEQTHTDSSPFGNRRKLGSSRRNKGRQQVKESVAQSYHEHKVEVAESTTGYEALETAQMIVDMERQSQEDHNKSETVLDTSFGAKLEVMDNSDTHHSENTVNKVHEQELNPTQMNEIDRPFKSVTQDATGNSEIIFGNKNQAEVNDTYPSELIIKNNDNSVMKKEDLNPDNKQDEDPPKEKSFDALGLTKGDYHVNDTVKQQISRIERVDTSLVEVYATEGQGEDDIKPRVEQVHQEKEAIFSEMGESESSLQTLQSAMNAPLAPQPQENKPGFNPVGDIALDQVYEGEGQVEDYIKPSVEHKAYQEEEGLMSESEKSEPLQTLQSEMNAPLDTQPQPNGTNLNPISNRRKLGSSRRSKGRQHAKDSVAESYQRPKGEGVLRIETAMQENFRETMLEGLDTLDTAQTEDICDQVKENALVDDIESCVMPDISTVKSSPGEHTEVEVGLERAESSSSKQEMHANEGKKEQVYFSQVREALYSDTVNEVQEEEVKSPGTRRKLGSSRRNKGRHHVKDSVTETYHKPEDEFVETTRGDEALEITNMSSATETTRQEELREPIDLDLKAAQKTRKIRSCENEEENTDKMQEEGTIFSQSVQDNFTVVTTNITSSSSKDDSVKFNKDASEEENNLIKEPENLSQHTGYDTVQVDLMQSLEVSALKDDSDIQNILYHDDNVTTRSVALDVLEHEDDYLVQKMEVCDKDSSCHEMNMQKANDTIETVGDDLIKECDTEAESSMDVQVCEQDDIEYKFEVPTKKDYETQKMYGSRVTERSEISTAVGACNNQQGIQEQTQLDYSEDLQGKSKQKKRKMGSTRRTQLKRKPDNSMDNEDETKQSDFSLEADVTHFDKMEVAEEILMIVTNEVSQNENVRTSLNPVTKDQQETNETSTGVVDAIKVAQVADVRDSEGNMDVKVQPSHIDDLTDTEMHLTSVLAGRNSCSIDQLLSSNTLDAANTGSTGGSFVSLCETPQSTQNNEERPERLNVMQDPTLESAEAPVVAVTDLEIVKSAVRGGAGGEHKDAQASIQEPDNTNEGAHTKNLEMKNAEPNLNSPSRRRKMGSTRRNLGSLSKGEDLHQKQEMDNEATEVATNVGDVKTESFPGIEEKEEQELHIEDKDSGSEQKKEKVFETVQYIHTGESHFKPPSQQTSVESPVSLGPLAETEHQTTHDYLPAKPSTSHKHDVMSETAGGRRRKLGSHRKSHGHQSNDNQTPRGDKMTDAQNGTDDRSIINESDVKATGEESLGLDIISEVDENIKKPSSDISTLKAGEPTRPANEKTPQRVTPVQQSYAESQNTFSLAGSSSGAGRRSNSYNVLMVGESSVGKTSFMKRAQSGKYSLDLPASVGLDSCMWPVVVDGKHVVLQLWDTAGQERFHSITKQIFHKAQAFLLMYDITSSQSFSAVSYWANCIQEGAAENVTILLLGNKSDRAERRIKTQDGESLAKEYNFEFMECSAATGENVIESLETVARMLSQKADTREETTVLHKEPQQKKSSGCC